MSWLKLFTKAAVKAAAKSAPIVRQGARAARQGQRGFTTKVFSKAGEIAKKNCR